MPDPRKLIEEARQKWAHYDESLAPAGAALGWHYSVAKAALPDITRLADALAAALDERDALRREVVILQYRWHVPGRHPRVALRHRQRLPVRSLDRRLSGYWVR